MLAIDFILGTGSRYMHMCFKSIPALAWRSLNEQVWSQTQLYSVDFSQSRIGVKSAFSTNAQSRFASVVVDSVLGPPCLVQQL